MGERGVPSPWTVASQMLVRPCRRARPIAVGHFARGRAPKKPPQLSDRRARAPARPPGMRMPRWCRVRTACIFVQCCYLGVLPAGRLEHPRFRRQEPWALARTSTKEATLLGASPVRPPQIAWARAAEARSMTITTGKQGPSALPYRSIDASTLRFTQPS